MTIIIAVSQAKGGAAKTTTTVNLAGALNEKGCSAMVLDWDTAKPDAIRWMKGKNSIDWIKQINTSDPLKDINDHKGYYDFIIFDTPPNYEPNAFKAIIACDYVIIPTSVNFLDQENTKDAISVPLMAKKPFKILMSRVKKGTKKGKEIYKDVASQDISFKTVITDRDVLAQCPASGEWIGLFAKGSDSHNQFLNLATEVIEWTSKDNLNL